MKTQEDYAEEFRAMHPRELADITAAAKLVREEYIAMLSGDAQLTLPIAHAHAAAAPPKGVGRPRGSANKTKAEQMADAAAEEADAVAVGLPVGFDAE